MGENRKLLHSLAGLLAILVVLGLTACGGTSGAASTATPLQPTPEPTPVRGSGGTLQMSFWEAPTILNPHLSFGIKDWEASRIVYEPLASFDENLELVPFLAAEIPTEGNGIAEDFRSVTWKLRPDVLWADGVPFTAEDVLFTYEFITNPDTGATAFATAYETIDSVEVIDDTTVRINFLEPNPAWSEPFVGIQGMILPKHLFEPYNGPNAREAPANELPIGTGPYYVEEFKPQEVLLLGTQLVETKKIVFNANPFFREPDKPYFGEIVLRGGGTINEAARSVLEDGLVHYAYNIQLLAEEMEEFEEITGIVQPNFRALVEQIDINQTDPRTETEDGELSSLSIPHPFFSDPLVRQAFAHAINREAIAALYGRGGQPTHNQLVAPEQYSSDQKVYAFDLQRAADLLAEAGWVDADNDGIREKGEQRLRVLFQTTVDPTREEILAIIKRDLESIGVDVEVKFIDASIFFSGDPENPNTADHFHADMQEFDIISRSPDPIPFLQNWTCDRIPQKENNWLAGFNSPRWCNPEFDALLEQARTERDLEQRRQMIIQLNNMLVEEVVMIPIIQIARLAGFSKDLEGVTLTPWDADTWNIKDWRLKAQ